MSEEFESVSLTGSNPVPTSVDDSGDQTRSANVPPEDGVYRDSNGNQITFDLHTQVTDSSSLSPQALIEQITSAPMESLIPWEEVELPSRGLYYGWDGGFVKVRAWGADTDKILATHRLLQSGQAIPMMIEKCTKFPDGFDFEDLLVGDQVFLLYYLRGITYGNIYEFIVTTPSGRKIESSFDMNDLASTIKYANPSIGEEPFRIKLPHLSKQYGRDISVHIRFMRIRDLRVIRERSKSMNSLGQQRARVASPGSPIKTKGAGADPTDMINQNLGHLIVKFCDADVDLMQANILADKLHSIDTSVIRDFMNHNMPSIDISIEIIDPDTGKEFKVMLPITESFFRSKRL